MKPTINIQEASTIFGVSTNTIKTWLRKGCPADKPGTNGRAWVLNLTDMIRWQNDQTRIRAESKGREDDVEEARRRKLVAEAELSEIQVKKERGEVIDIELSGKMLDKVLANVTAKLLAMPHKVAPYLLNQTNTTDVIEILTPYIHDTIKELAIGGEQPSL